MSGYTLEVQFIGNNLTVTLLLGRPFRYTVLSHFFISVKIVESPVGLENGAILKTFYFEHKLT